VPEYQYEALDQNGATRKGVIAADSESEARRKVREAVGYVVSLRQLEPSGGQDAPGAPGAWRRRLAALFAPRVRQEDIVALTRQIATLLRAGIPLDEALAGMLQGNAPPALRSVVNSLRERLREGGSLAAGLAEFPRVFDTGFVALVQAGEASGSLASVMERLADAAAGRREVHRKMKAAMAYPVLMLLVGGCILGFLLSFVVPKVTQLFVNARQALPLPTVILLAVSDWFAAWWPVLAPAPAALWLAFARAMKVPALRLRWHALQLRLPVVGELVRCAVLGRVAHTIAMLLQNGVPLLKSLDIARGVANNAVMENTVDHVAKSAEAGGSLAAALETSPFLRSSDVQLVAAGERSGQLEAMLFIVAADNEDKAVARTRMLTALMEPLLILFLGITVGFVVLAIILPIFEMSSLVR
jgi:general secretion pathway protein F